MFMENDMTCLCGWKGALVYHFLVYKASADGRVKASVNTISKNIDIGRSSTKLGIKDLLQQNLLSVNSGKGKILEKNEYILLEYSHWKTSPDGRVATI